MYKFFTFLCLISFNWAAAQNVYIPDPIFKNYLLGNSAINTNGDTAIQVSEANAFTGTISCIGLGITDLTGLGAFTSVTILNCNSTSVTDVSNVDWSLNTSLHTVLFATTPLMSLDLSQGAAVTKVNVSSCGSLSSLNVANGNNTNFAHFQTINTPNLDCIQVDNVSYSNANWTGTSAFSFDASDVFSLNCNTTSIRAVNNPVPNLKIYPNPTQEIINIDLEELYAEVQVEISNVLGQVIQTQTYFNTALVRTGISEGSGAYFIKVRTSEARETIVKVLKE